jgi:hypothetical protein
LDITTRSIKEPVVKLRLATDAMFFALSNQLGQECQALFTKRADNETGLCIFQDILHNGWILQISPEERYLCASFTHAFVFCRRFKKDVSEFVKGVQMNGYDSHFFAPNGI